MKMLAEFGRCSFLILSIFAALSTCQEGDSSISITGTTSLESSPTITLLAPSTATSCQYSAPTATPPSTTSRCCKYYIVQSGDTCDAVASQFRITFSDLQALNPDLNDGCGNLLLGVAYV